MQGPIEREHPMMAMVTNGQRTATRPAPLLLDCQFDACELRVFWPAIRHEGPLLVQDMVGNQHTIYRPMCVLAFYRIVDFKRPFSSTQAVPPSARRRGGRQTAAGRRAG